MNKHLLHGNIGPRPSQTKPCFELWCLYVTVSLYDSPTPSARSCLCPPLSVRRGTTDALGERGEADPYVRGSFKQHRLGRGDNEENTREEEEVV